MAPRLVVLVPTRNRPELALAAVKSMLSASVPEVRIIVSDNSGPQARSEVLRELSGLDVTVVATPDELAMADHWSWALDQALDRLNPTHISVLTDRFVYKRGALSAMARHLLPAFPDEVIVHNHDHLADVDRPVRIMLERGSGRVFAIRPQAILDRVAAGEAWNWELPRMMNAVVPVRVFDAVRERAGRVFGSIAPDHYFGYWAAALEGRFVCWDASPSVHYAQTRSNGFAQTTGEPRSADADDFKRRSLTRGLQTPFPAVHTLSNFIFHEYSTVAVESGSSRFAPLRQDVVAAALRRDATRDVADPVLRGAVLDAIGDPGARAASPAPAARGWRWALRDRRRRAEDLALGAFDPQAVAGACRARPAIVQRLAFPATEPALAVAVTTNKRSAQSRPVGTTEALLDPFWGVRPAG